MKTQLRSLAAILALSLSAASAQALTMSTSITSLPTSEFSGVTTVNFGNSQVNNDPNTNGGRVSGNLPSGNNYNYTGGGLYNHETSSTMHYSTSARPSGSENNYWSIGGTQGQNYLGVVTFTTPVNYFGFLWGTPDGANVVTFYDKDNNVLSTKNGYEVFSNYAGLGTYEFAKYFNFSTDSNAIYKVTFASDANVAFETDNHSFAAAVPEPETYAMLLAGLGLMGGIARRRKQAK